MQIVSYLRVSTARQGASGLGLEAQREAVARFTAAGGHTLLAEFVEVESGAKAARPNLAAALTSCRLHRAPLVIAKLDRLARNMAFIANLVTVQGALDRRSRALAPSCAVRIIPRADALASLRDTRG